MKFYSLKSKSLDFFNTPFLAADDVSAMYQVRCAIMSDRDGSLSANTDDLLLYCLGSFDNRVGLVVTEPTLILGDVSHFRRKESD